MSSRRKTPRRRPRLRRRNNQGSITQRQDGRWQVVFSVKDRDGTMKRRYWYRKTEDEAERLLSELVVRHGRGDLTLGDATTFAELVSRWLSIRTENVRPTTRHSYTRLLEMHVLPSLADVQVGKLKKADLEDLLVSLRQRGLGARSRRYVLWLVQSVLQYAIEHEFISKNVAASITVKDASVSTRRKVWTPEEASRFLEVAREDRLGIMFMLMLACGLRRGEMLGLRWSSVFLDQAALQIETTLCKAVSGGVEFGEPKTVASRRTVYLSEDVVQALRAHKERQADERSFARALWVDNDLVVCTTIGTPIHPDNVKRVMKRLCDEARVKVIRVHDLRHTHASLALNHGVDAKVVSERLGHTNVVFTRSTYQHTYVQQHRMAALPLETLTREAETS